MANHRLIVGATEGLLKLRYVAHYAVDAKISGRMRIGLGTKARKFGPTAFAPHLREAQEKALVGGESVTRRRLLTGEVILERHVGEAHAAVIGRVLAERELAVDVDVVDDREAAVFVHDARGTLVEGFRVGRRPPVAQIAFGIELPALVVERMCKLA